MSDLPHQLLVFFLGLCSLYVHPFASANYSLPKGPLSFSSIRPPSCLEMKDREDAVMAYSCPPSSPLRLYKPLSELSRELSEWVVFLEDAKFFFHKGFDVEEIKNSALKNLEEGQIKRGGSTITQQLAKNLFLSKERSLLRKLYEVPWTLRLERDLSKKQILELYLNAIEWGPGVYGAEAAARHYFDQSAHDLTPEQAAYLAVIVPGPVKYDLLGRPKARAAVEHRYKNLARRLFAEKKISEDQRDRLLQMNFELAPLDQEKRKYPLWHEGAYLGSLKNLSPELLRLEKWARSLKPSKAESIGLTLIRAFQRQLEKEPLINSPGASERYFLWKVDGAIAAFRILPKGKTIVFVKPETLPGELMASEKLGLEDLLYK